MNIYEKAINHYGKENQLHKTKEELAELIVAINQHMKTEDKLASEDTEELFKQALTSTLKQRRFDLVQEIADVEIMLTQLKMVLNINATEVREVKQFKLERLVKRIETDNDRSNTVQDL